MDVNAIPIVIVGLIWTAVQKTDCTISCTAPSVPRGEEAIITCFFNKDVDELKTDIIVRHINTSRESVVVVDYDSSGTLQKLAPGYEVQLSNRTLTLTIPSAEQKYEGRYRCEVAPSESGDTELCNFTLGVSEGESSTKSAVLEETTLNGTTDEEGNNRMKAWEIALIVAVPVLALFVFITIAIIYWKRRKRRKNSLQEITEAVEHLPREVEPMNDTVESPTHSKECAETQVLISETKPSHSVDDSTEQNSKVTLGSDRAYFPRGAPEEGGEVAEQSAPHPEEDRRHSQIPNPALPRPEDWRDVANMNKSPYDQAINALQQTNIVVLVGPEKCGKTKLGQDLLQHYTDKGYTQIYVREIINFWKHEKGTGIKYSVFMDEAIKTSDGHLLHEKRRKCFSRIREKGYPTVVAVKSTETNEDEIKKKLYPILQNVPIVFVPGRNLQNRKTRHKTLLTACEGGDVEDVKSLVKSSAGVNATDEKNRTLYAEDRGLQHPTALLVKINP